MKRHRLFLPYLAAACLVWPLATTAAAQSPDRSAGTAQRDTQRQQDHPPQGRARSGQRDWIRIAIDYDRDGTFDAAETIHYDELETARDRSRQRRFASPSQSRGRATQPSRSVGPVRVRGKLSVMRSIDLVGDDEKDVVIGKLATDTGRTVSVYLGPSHQVERLDLQQGDQVTVEGVPSWINENPFVIGRRISSGDRSITNRMPRQQPLRRFQGEIVDLRNTEFGDRDGSYLVARLQTPDGRSQRINLGRRRELDQLKLQEGDRISVLARRGTINKRPAIIAQLVRAHDQVADVREQTRQELRR
jgi:hypothetical protein